MNRSEIIRAVTLIRRYEPAARIISQLNYLRTHNRLPSRRLMWRAARAYMSISPNLRQGLNASHAARARTAFIRLCVHLGVDPAVFDPDAGLPPVRRLSPRRR